MARGPVGFYTVGKGSGRVVHPVCGPCSRYIARVKKLEALAKKEQSFAEKGRGKKPKRFRIVASPEHLRLKSHKRIVKGESALNLKVTNKLQRRYPGRVQDIIDAAQSAYHYHHPTSQISAEPYELAEGGYITEAFESMGLSGSFNV